MILLKSSYEKRVHPALISISAENDVIDIPLNIFNLIPGPQDSRTSEDSRYNYWVLTFMVVRATLYDMEYFHKISKFCSCREKLGLFIVKIPVYPENPTFLKITQ